MLRRPPTPTLFPYTTLFRSKHKRRLRRGEVFPPFLYVSIINSCNLRCQGCWVDVAAKQEIIDRKSTRLNSSHVEISYAVFCLKKKDLKACETETRRIQLQDF